MRGTTRSSMRGALRTAMFAAAAVLAIAAAILPAAAEGPKYTIGQGKRWLTSGGGFIEKGVFRVNMENSGWLEFTSYISGDQEVLTGYKMRGRLEASIFDIGIWEDEDDHVYPEGEWWWVMPPDFDPSANGPYTLPTIEIGDEDVTLRYTFTLHSENAGELTVHGTADVDAVGTCEVKATNALWREGTERPPAPDDKSGCTAASPPAALALAAAALLRKRSYSDPRSGLPPRRARQASAPPR